MHPTRFIPICFFHTFSGLERVIFTLCCWFVSSFKWNLGFEVQVNLSTFYSNCLSFKWHPPADFSVHLPDSTALLASSSIWISHICDEKTKIWNEKFMFTYCLEWNHFEFPLYSCLGQWWRVLELADRRHNEQRHHHCNSMTLRTILHFKFAICAPCCSNEEVQNLECFRFL